MKRLISLFLALLLALPLALPIFAVEAEGESETLVYPTISEADYNKLYVQGDLAMAADFFKMNEHWNLDGTVYKVPVGPSLNTAFQYDIDGDGTAESYDLTKAENRALKVTADFEPKIRDGHITVEDIQDSVESVLIQAGYDDVAKAYIL